MPDWIACSARLPCSVWFGDSRRLARNGTIVSDTSSDPATVPNTATGSERMNLPDPSGRYASGRESEEQHPGAAEDGDGDLPGAVDGRRRPVFAFAQAAGDVLGDHD